jgi:hypothetical protein
MKAEADHLALTRRGRVLASSPVRLARAGNTPIPTEQVKAAASARSGALYLTGNTVLEYATWSSPSAATSSRSCVPLTIN